MSRLEAPLMLAATMVTAALVFGDVHGPARTTVALLWLSLAPGLAFTQLAGFREMGIRLVLAVPFSLALAAVTSGVLVYAGIPSWELGMSVLLSLTVAAVILHLAPPRLNVRLGWEAATDVRGKLAEEPRQARMVEALLAGGTLADAAEAAGVSLVTLRRRLRSSEALRRAVEVASGGSLEDLEADPPSRESLSR